MFLKHYKNSNLTKFDLSAINFEPERIQVLVMLQNKHLKPRNLLGFCYFLIKCSEVGLKMDISERQNFQELFLQNCKNAKFERFMFLAITLKPIEIQKRTICQNKH